MCKAIQTLNHGIKRLLALQEYCFKIILEAFSVNSFAFWGFCGVCVVHVVSVFVSLVLFVCCQAARVFIGSKQRLKVNVPSLQTPSARRAAHGAVSYKWAKAEAIKAFEAHLQMAKDLAL